MIARTNFVEYFENYSNLKNFGLFKAQQDAVERLDSIISARDRWQDLRSRLGESAPPSSGGPLKGLSRSLTQSLKSSWSGKVSLTEQALRNKNLAEERGTPTERRKQGAYIFGPVGQGKTVLLDVVGKYLTEGEGAPLKPENVLRCHYHHFMLAVHKMLHELRTLGKNMKSFRQHLQASSQSTEPVGGGGAFLGSSDYILQLIKNIVKDENVKIILLDECQITTISDAMIFKRFFTEAFKRGLNLICTSNCPIDELYAGGLNRDAFTDFIPILRQHLEEIHLDLKKDLRTFADSPSCSRQVTERVVTQDSIAPMSRLCIVTPCRSPHTIITELLNHKVFFPEHMNQSLPLFHGRTMKVDLFNPHNRQLVISFDEACCQNRSPSDFIAIAQAAPNGIWLHSVPVLDLAQEPERVRRFISLLDVVYDEHIPMLLDMSAPPLCIVRGTTSLFEIIVTIARAIRQNFSDYSTAWNAIFKNGSERNWRDGCSSLGIWGEDASLLWNTLTLNQGDRITIDTLRQAICFCIVHGLADASVWIGECFREKPTSAPQLWVLSLLQFLGGISFPECIQIATEFSGVLNPANQIDDKGTIDVAFAVPRLISRLCEIQIQHQTHHPLLSAGSTGSA